MLLQPLTNIFCAPAVFPTLLAPGIQRENPVCFSTAFHVGEKNGIRGEFCRKTISIQFNSLIEGLVGQSVCQKLGK